MERNKVTTTMKSMKTNSILFAAISFSSMLILGCGNSTFLPSAESTIPAFDIAAMKISIGDKTQKFTHAHITRDTSYLNSVFAQDAKSYPPNSNAVVGLSAISAINSDWVNYGIKEFREESINFYGNSEFLIDEGIYYLRYGDVETIDEGKYINIWKKENGEWKMVSNMWNTSLPSTLSN